MHVYARRTPLLLDNVNIIQCTNHADNKATSFFFFFYLYQIYQYIISVNTTTSTKNNHFTIVSLDHMSLSLDISDPTLTKLLNLHVNS